MYTLYIVQHVVVHMLHLYGITIVGDLFPFKDIENSFSYVLVALLCYTNVVVAIVATCADQMCLLPIIDQCFSLRICNLATYIW